MRRIALNISNTEVTLRESADRTNGLNLSGLQELWSESYGDPRVCVAILDGAIDQSHPAFVGAQLRRLPSLVSRGTDEGQASSHGTHVASIIFGQHHSSISGIAPGCQGLLIPIFFDGPNDSIVPCPQIDLARAIMQAVEAGAHIINISGGQLTPSGEADQFLINAIRNCVENNVLIVAAVGNDGCNCLHIPAALPSVLAVGAMDTQGNPIDFSNWGEVYQTQGVLAPGTNILGAVPGGGTALKSGTSFATPMVTGIVALLLSIQLAREQKIDPLAIREAILESALPCNPLEGLDCRRFLAGSLNIPGIYSLIIQKKGGKKDVSDQTSETILQPSESDSLVDEVTNQQPIEVKHQAESDNVEPVEFSAQLPISSRQAAANTAYRPIMPFSEPTAMSMGKTPMAITSASVTPSSITPSEGCACDGGALMQQPMQLVYALGELGTDFGTEARRDSFTQAMFGMELLEYLAQNEFAAQHLIWTLNLDATPIYAINPSGAFARDTYQRLRDFLSDENVERVSIPGVISGTVRLLSGQIVPTITPDIRGMYSWSVDALLDAVQEQLPEQTREQIQKMIREYLNRIYYEFRNLGQAPEERALNYSATNVFQLSAIMAEVVGDDQALGTIMVEKSPICRPDSDCYDVKLRFFDISDQRRAGRVYRFTIDVSDVLPVSIGPVRSWSEAFFF